MTVDAAQSATVTAAAPLAAASSVTSQPTPIPAQKDAGVGGMIARALVSVAVLSCLLGFAVAIVASWNPPAQVATQSGGRVSATWVLYGSVVSLVVLFSAAAAALAAALAARGLIRRIGASADALAAAAQAAERGEPDVRVQLGSRAPLRAVGQTLQSLIDAQARQREAASLRLQRIDESMQRLSLSIELVSRHRDLSVQLPRDTGPLADSLQALLSDLAGWLSTFWQQTSEVADATVQVRSHVEQVRYGSAQQQEAVEMAVQALSRVASATADLPEALQSVQRICLQHGQSLAEGLGSGALLVDHIQSMRQRVQAATQGAARIETSAQALGVLLEGLTRVARDAQLLSLNASMQAGQADATAQQPSDVCAEVDALSRTVMRLVEQFSQAVAQLRAQSAQCTVQADTLGAEFNSVLRRAGEIAHDWENARQGVSEIQSQLAAIEKSVCATPEAAHELGERAKGVQVSHEELGRLLQSEVEVSRRLASVVGDLLDGIATIRLPHKDAQP
jgi:methyl-accepting chemotaxis protein